MICTSVLTNTIGGGGQGCGCAVVCGCGCEIIEPGFVHVVKNCLVIPCRCNNSFFSCAFKKIDQPINEINCKVR